MNKSIEQNLAEGGIHVSTTSGYSMYPMLRDRRDRVIIRPIGDTKLSKYDLPLYKRPDGKYVLHRIIKVREDHYIIRGDNTYALETVPFDWVIGYVSEFYRKERHVMSNSRFYRFYAVFWNWIYPIRWCYRKVRGLLSRIKHKLFDRK